MAFGGGLGPMPKLRHTPPKLGLGIRLSLSEDEIMSIALIARYRGLRYPLSNELRFTVIEQAHVLLRLTLTLILGDAEIVR